MELSDVLLLLVIGCCTCELNTNTHSGVPISQPLCAGGSVLPNAQVPHGFCPIVWATGLNAPRGVAVASNNDVLVVEAGVGRVTVLWDANNNGVSDGNERAALTAATGLNHGVSINGGFLYASSSSTVYRWPYTAGQRANLGTGAVVISGIPGGGHVTRTISFDSTGRLYVSIGSASNVDPDSTRARIVRFDISSLPGGGLAWSAGTVFADGLRNAVAMEFDSSDRLWIAVNGVDNLNRADLGGDIHDTNPAEEVFVVDQPGGRYHGYPNCFSCYILNGYTPLTKFVHPDFTSSYNDAWCRDPNNVVAPAAGMMAHTAPLDLHLWQGGGFPSEYTGDLFISQHGSWNSPQPVGYRVVRFHVVGGLPSWSDNLLIFNGDAQSGSGWIRPVAVAGFSCSLPSGGGATQCLLIGSDATGQLVSMAYDASLLTSSGSTPATSSGAAAQSPTTVPSPSLEAQSSTTPMLAGTDASAAASSSGLSHDAAIGVGVGIGVGVPVVALATILAVFFLRRRTPAPSPAGVVPLSPKGPPSNFSESYGYSGSSFASSNL